MELGAAKVTEQTEAEDEDELVEKPWHFNTKELVISFCENVLAMAMGLIRWHVIEIYMKSR
jgi:hypothetical protein